MSPVTLSLLLWSVTAASAGSCVVGVWRVVVLLESLLAHVKGENAKPTAVLFRRKLPDVTPVPREYH